MTTSSLRSFRAAIGLTFAVPFMTAGTTTVDGPPLGVISAQLGPGTHALAFPLIREELFAGIIAGNSGGNVSFTAGQPAARLSVGAKYYLEIVTGPLEGERLDLDTAATIAAGGASLVLKLGAGTFSTPASLAPDVLALARAVIRPHLTLGAIAGQFTPALVGNNNVALADGIQLYQNGVLTTFYLRADNVTWRESGKTVDERGKVIAPDTSLLLVLRSGAKRWANLGGVRTNAFVIPLSPGARALATGFPLDLSPQQIGAQVDLNLPATIRWTGSNTATAADTLKVYENGAFATYYLRADGISWYRAGDTTDVAAAALLKARGMVVLARLNPDPDYLILRPFQL